MNLFETIEKQGEHEEIVICYNKEAGLKAIIAIHNTALGPALGGTRMWNYKTDEEALIDVLRLSRGMTYKAAAAGLNLGGGKAVIIGDSKTQKTEAMFRAFGQYIQSLNGRYITAEDVGTSVKDMEWVYAETPWVTGIPKALGGSGDPSPFTAYGVFMGMKASAKEKLGTDSLKGVRIAVQGLGHVGYHLVEHLTKDGAVVTVSDIDQEKTKQVEKQFNVKVTSPEQILFTDCDVLAPCALGAVFNDQTIPKLKTKIICGAANNQLAEARHGQVLKEAGILFAPDYVVNAGGLMNVFVELETYSTERAMAKAETIYSNVQELYKIAKSEDIPTNVAADRLAERRIEQVGRLKQRHSGFNTRAYGTLKVTNR